MTQPITASSSADSPVTLIVGCDGRVGNALMASLARSGKRVVGTTRRTESVDDSHIFLDLSHDLLNWQTPWPVEVALLCAGVTSIDACRRDPATTARVNVHGVATLVENLIAKGAFVVYLSSIAVFDGGVPYPKQEDSPSPATEYGRQRVETERLVNQFGDSAAIVRFSRILEPREALFSAWKESLGKGQPIYPFSDMKMAPLPVSCAVSVLRLVSDQRLAGTLQVSGNRDISYADAARVGAAALEADVGLVRPVLASEAHDGPSWLPRYTTMNIHRLRATLGIEPPDVSWTVRSSFIRPAVFEPSGVLSQTVGGIPRAL